MNDLVATEDTNPSSMAVEVGRLADELDGIHDVATLRQLVLDKERDLHVAARLGLAVAKKNQEIEDKVTVLTGWMERQLKSGVFTADKSTRVRSEVGSFRKSGGVGGNGMAQEDGMDSGEEQDVDVTVEGSTRAHPNASSPRHRKSSSRATMSHHSAHPSGTHLPSSHHHNHATLSPSEETEIWLRSITRSNFDLRRDIESLREELSQARKELVTTQTRLEEYDQDAVETRRRLAATDKQVDAVRMDVSETAEVAHALKQDFDAIKDVTRAHITETKGMVRQMGKEMANMKETVEGLRVNVETVMQRLEGMEERVSQVVEESTRLLYQAQGTISVLREGGGNGLLNAGLTPGSLMPNESVELDPDFARVMFGEDDARGLDSSFSTRRGGRNTAATTPHRTNELADAFPTPVPISMAATPTSSSRRSSQSGTGIAPLAFSPLEGRKPNLGLKHLFVERERERALMQAAATEQQTLLELQHITGAQELIASTLERTTSPLPSTQPFGRADRVRVIHRYNM